MDQSQLLAQLMGSGEGEWVKVSEPGDEVKVVLTYVRVEQETDYKTRQNKYLVKRKVTETDKTIAAEMGYQLKVDKDGYIWKPMTEDKITDQMRQDPEGVVNPIWQVSIRGVDGTGKPLKYTIQGAAKMKSWGEAMAAAGVQQMVAGGRFKQVCVDKKGQVRTYESKYVAPEA